LISEKCRQLPQGGAPFLVHGYKAAVYALDLLVFIGQHLTQQFDFPGRTTFSAPNKGAYRLLVQLISGKP
jgi:hypothetical protein